MKDPYNWNFPQRQETMYMSTIDGPQNDSNYSKPTRQSSFLKNDIEGALPKTLIPPNVYRKNYNHSTYVQPKPQYARSIQKVSNPLYHHDIEYSYPKAVQFKTNRHIDPLIPHYKLPTSQPVSVADPPKFLRDNIDVSDIAERKLKNKSIKSPKEEVVEKSIPKKLFKSVEAIQRLDVKDINNDGIFVSRRRYDQNDPLNPIYQWRDNVDDKVGLSFTKGILKQEKKKLNPTYGQIDKTKATPSIKVPANRDTDFSLKIRDIEGTLPNSSNQNKYFFDKRKDYRDVMKVNDIEKTTASSLKKGIATNRNLNPLVPSYKYPS